ncbi:MAG: LacI family DNA-binding transcriptional regulator [Catenulispora sp.]|nr:LacI family DNA-binding transcriptional regulator [Catenulispora sp.]
MAVEAGEPVRGVARPRLRDVAALAGVSHQTVSRVFKDDASVRAQTRERVMDAAARLDYRPNAIARALATGSSRTLGVISFDTALFGPASAISAIESSARGAGYYTSVMSLSQAGHYTVAEVADRLRGQGVDGVVLIPGHVPVGQILRHLPARLPTVVLGRSSDVPAIGIDHCDGARAAVNYLLELGHRTVHHVPGPEDWPEACERFRGWWQALAAKRVPVPPVLPGDWSAMSGYTRGCVLAADREVTAVFAANDHIALGVLWALQEAGRRVPEDVSVIGFDGVPEAAYFTPPLTTVRQDFAEIGRRGVELLVEQIGARHSSATVPDIRPVQATIPSGLIVRRSTTRPVLPA